MAGNRPLSSEESGGRIDVYDKPNRISKHDLYLLLALWVEKSPFAKDPKEEGARKMGIVIIKEEGALLALDVTRKNGIHPIIANIAYFQGQIKGCNIYTSRPPCANCTKHMVQGGVRRVFHLPLIHERLADKDMVDRHLRVRDIGVTHCVPHISKDMEERVKGIAKVKPKKDDLGSLYAMKEEFMEQYDLYQEHVGQIENPEKMRASLDRAINWLISSLQLPDNVTFSKSDETVTDPTFLERDVSVQLKLHSLRLAHLLSFRTDDPKRGVGCLIMKGDKYISIGWNGFPLGAEHSDYPRGGEDIEDKSKQKYNFVIHAEYNALFFRNERKIDKCEVYVNKTPCKDCAPLLATFGVKTVVIPYEKSGPQTAPFRDMVQEGSFLCWEAKY